MSNNYLPLHHKYRPQRFDDLIGQEMIVKTLKQALITNRIAPAYLFCGPRGTGKTSSARILARSLNCLSNNQATTEPCGKCEICKTISTGTALDVIEIDAASNTGVDNIRDLIEKSRFAPVQARWKVYVIDECHMLSTAAFNALLKTLEEPPNKSVFILATTDPQRLLPTIISRCQRFDFRRISLSLLEDNLETVSKKEDIKINKDALSLIANRSQGGLRDAQRMLDQLSLLPQPIALKSVWDLLGEVPEKEIISLVWALIKEEPINLIKVCRTIIDDGNEPIAIIQGLASILRDIVIKKSAPNEPNLCSISEDLHPDLERISLEVDRDKILIWQANLKGSENLIRQSYQPRLWLEVFLIGMLAKKTTIIENKNFQEKKEISIAKAKSIDIKQIDNVAYREENKINPKKIEEEITDMNLDEIWNTIITKVELPSTRMLLSQQARLSHLTKENAEIHVSSNWIGMIQSRKNLLEEAITKTLGKSRKIILSSEKRIQSNKVLDKYSNKDQQIKDENKKEDSSKKKDKSIEEIANKKTLNLENDHSIDEKTQRFADFFNGEIIDT